MKGPMIWVCGCLAAGILLAERCDFSLPETFATAFLLVLLYLLRRSERGVCLMGTLCLLGLISFEVRHRAIAPNDLRNIIQDEQRFVVLRGRLLETPIERVSEGKTGPRWRTSAQFRVEQWEGVDGQWIPVTGTVLVRTAGLLPRRFFKGSRVEVSGAISRPDQPRALGLFDYRQYLERQNIFYQLRAEGPGSWKLLSPFHIPWSESFLAWAKKILSRGVPQDTALELELAMTLGWKTALTEEVTEPFLKSGTMHVFAISGMHISLITEILLVVFGLLPFPQRRTTWMVIPLIWLYTAATGWQPSAVRSTVMSTILIGGNALQRPVDLLNSLAGAAFLILLWQPEQLFQASFQLSFVVVFSIALIMPHAQNWVNWLVQTDPMLPESLVPWWRLKIKSALRYIGLIFFCSLAAWLGALLITAYYFHIVTPNSMLSNMAVVPLSTVTLVCNVASLFVGGWWPSLAELFNYSGWFCMHLMIQLSDWSARIPGGYFYVPTPPFSVMVFYYAVGTLLGMSWFWKYMPKPLFFAGLFVVSSFHLGVSRGRAPSAVIHLLPLAGGHAVLTQSRDGPVTLVDCGDESSFDFVVKPYLQAQGINRLHGLFLTHGDAKHVAGALDLVENFEILKIREGPLSFRSTVYRKVRQSLQNLKILEPIESGQSAQGWHCLFPAGEDSIRTADDGCLVFWKQVAGWNILHLGDLSRTGQQKLFERYPNLQADIVLAGLPQGNGHPPFYEFLSPKWIFFADDVAPAQAKVTPPQKKSLQRPGSTVLFTSESGGIVLEFFEQEILIRSTFGGPAISPRPQPAERSTFTEM